MQSDEKYLDGLKSGELLLKLTWDEWLAITPPYSEREVCQLQMSTVRYQRNGYDWDMHGTLYTPEKETDPRRAFVFFHGGAAQRKDHGPHARWQTGIGSGLGCRKASKSWR